MALLYHIFMLITNDMKWLVATVDVIDNCVPAYYHSTATTAYNTDN